MVKKQMKCVNIVPCILSLLGMCALPAAESQKSGLVTTYRRHLLQRPEFAQLPEALQKECSAETLVAHLPDYCVISHARETLLPILYNKTTNVMKRCLIPENEACQYEDENDAIRRASQCDLLSACKRTNTFNALISCVADLHNPRIKDQYRPVIAYGGFQNDHQPKTLSYIYQISANGQMEQLEPILPPHDAVCLPNGGIFLMPHNPSCLGISCAAQGYALFNPDRAAQSRLQKNDSSSYVVHASICAPCAEWGVQALYDYEHNRPLLKVISCTLPPIKNKRLEKYLEDLQEDLKRAGRKITYSNTPQRLPVIDIDSFVKGTALALSYTSDSKQLLCASTSEDNCMVGPRCLSPSLILANSLHKMNLDKQAIESAVIKNFTRNEGTALEFQEDAYTRINVASQEIPLGDSIIVHKYDSASPYSIKKWIAHSPDNKRIALKVACSKDKPSIEDTGGIHLDICIINIENNERIDIPMENGSVEANDYLEFYEENNQLYLYLRSYRSLYEPKKGWKITTKNNKQRLVEVGKEKPKLASPAQPLDPVAENEPVPDVVLASAAAAAQAQPPQQNAAPIAIAPQGGSIEPQRTIEPESPAQQLDPTAEGKPAADAVPANAAGTVQEPSPQKVSIGNAAANIKSGFFANLMQRAQHFICHHTITTFIGTVSIAALAVAAKNVISKNAGPLKKIAVRTTSWLSSAIARARTMWPKNYQAHPVQ